MTYANDADLVERAGPEEMLQIADRNDDGTPDPEVITAALVHADNIANGYIATRYALPLAGSYDLLRTWAVSIARYFLHRDGAPDHVRDDYTDAIAGLKDIARGVVSLPGADGASPAAAAGTHAAIIPPETFSSSRLAGW